MKYLTIAVASGATIFLIFGVVTDLIPNPWFIRMVESKSLDYFFLAASSVLFGSYVAVHFYKRTISKKRKVSAYAGGVASFLGFGCVLCNKILLLLLGAAGALAYVEPYRPFIGFAGLGLMGYAVYGEGKVVIINRFRKEKAV